MSRSIRTRLLVVVAVVALVVAGGFVWRVATGSGGEVGTTSSSDSSTGTGSDDPTVADLTEEYLSADATAPSPVASQEGTVHGTATDGSSSAQKHSGTLQVLAVDAGDDSTLVRYTLASDVEVTPDTSFYLDVPDRSLRSPELIAKSADLRLQASNWKTASQVTGDCVCSWLPSTIGPEAIQLSILYPSLPESVTEVQFSVPGFDPFTVSVTRDQ